MWKLWQQDLADGCWNGRSGAAADAPRLFYGGTQALGDDPARRGLANAIAGYITSNRNATPFAGIADVLPLLDDIATGGNATAAGACPGGTLLPPTAATGFDQRPPVITVTPALVAGADPIVRGAVPVVALAVDPDGIDPRPTLRVTGPAAFVDRDDDGDATDADVRFTVDTAFAVGAEGTLDLAFESLDDSTNRGTATRRLVVDNLAPAVTITGVVDGGAYPPPRAITYDVVDSHLASVTATLDGAPFASGAAAVAPGLHTLTVVARDVPGNATTVTRGFRVDGAAPVITVTGVTAGGFHQPPVTVGFSAADVDLATVTATLDGAVFVSGGMVAAEGPHALLVTAADHAGNQAELPVAFVIDGTRPDVVITGIAADGFTRAASVTLGFGQTDANPGGTTATLDGVAVASPVTVVAEGGHDLVVVATDAAGNIRTASHHFTIDRTAPAITIAGVVEGGAYQQATPTIDVADLTLDTTDATLDGVAYPPGAVIATEGPHLFAVTATDRAGNVASASVHFSIDRTPPLLALDLAGLTGVDGVLWTVASPTPLAGTVSDLDLVGVRAVVPGIPDVVATVTGGAWALTVPAGRIATAAPGTDLTIVATDRAGNSATVARTFRRDANDPVVAFVNTTVRNERSDVVTFSPGLLPSDRRINHAHMAGPTTLGPATACDATAPSVVKYAYLLDETRSPYVTETAPTNPLSWRFTTTDDGIGVDPTSVAYRVRDVAADQIVLDWTPLAASAPGTYEVRLFRQGTTAAAVPALGTRTGLFELEIRSRDRAGRLASADTTRCWNHEPLPAPLEIGAAEAATHGPPGSGKYALPQLRLEDTTGPYDPIGAEVLTEGAAGTGLIQIPVVNAATEPVYLTIDLQRPQGARFARTVVSGKTAVDVETGAVDCGPSIDSDGVPIPADTSLPWCTVGVPAGTSGTTTSAGPGDAAGVVYGVRVWEEVSAATFVEISASCPTCDQTSPPGRVRLTVRLPARLPIGVLGDPAPARRFWVVPVVGTIRDLAPDTSGPFTELQAGGVTVTGEVLSTTRRCALPLTAAGGQWHCTARRTARTFNALKAATFQPTAANPSTITADVAVSVDGALIAPPTYTGPSRAGNVPVWTTSEPAGL